LTGLARRHVSRVIIRSAGVDRATLSFNGDARRVIASAHRTVEDGAMFAFRLKRVQACIAKAKPCSNYTSLLAFAPRA